MTLKSELSTDPIARGYATMTTDQTVASLLAANRSTYRNTITACELYEATINSEMLALTADQRFVYQVLTGMTAPIFIGPLSKTRADLLAMFGAGSTTRANIIALVTLTVSRADELGLSLDWGMVNSARTSLGWAV